MRGWHEVMAVSTLCGMAGLASAQSATVRIEGPFTPPGEIVTLTVFVDFGGLPADALGLAGWDIEIDVGGSVVTNARYVTPASPLIDQNRPFGGDPTPQVSGSTVRLSEGLNALFPAERFHTGGALAEITIDTTGETYIPRAYSRRGDNPLGAFTYAMPAPEPFSFIGFDFDNVTYGRWFSIPTPATLGVLAVGGLFGVRRRCAAFRETSKGRSRPG